MFTSDPSHYGFPVEGHDIDDEFCVITGSPFRFRNNQTGKHVRVASYNGDSVWVVNEDGTKNNWNIYLFFRLFTRVNAPEYLCSHCGFGTVEENQNLCWNCATL